MAPHSSSSTGTISGRDLIHGAVLQCIEAATLGMPFEVWKTRMGRYRNESTIQSFKNVYHRGGITAFWAGLGPKLVESATKGGILLFSKESMARALDNAGVSKTLNGFISGAGGGVCQTVVMGPCTFLVTGAVTGDKSVSTMQRIRTVWSSKGISGFYPGGVPIAFRQATNWASRQGFTELIRAQLKTINHANQPNAQLSVGEEALAGIIGGAISCWNHPFEVARIQMQASADQNQAKQGMMKVFATVYKEHGVGGLFKGIIPRVCLGIWQTLFMVTGAKLVKRFIDPPPPSSLQASASRALVVSSNDSKLNTTTITTNKPGPSTTDQERKPSSSSPSSTASVSSTNKTDPPKS